MAFQFLNRDSRLPGQVAEIERCFDETGDDWLMTDAERLALVGLLTDMRPECAIEVGVYEAGSLSILSRYCKKVYALDKDPSCEEQYADKFNNVEFITGDACHTLPKVLAKIETANEALDFVLIDADHSREGVKRDIESVLQYTPSKPLYILMHDSFNPECRRGIKQVAWSGSPHVHLVELDFVTGKLLTKEEQDGYRQMWCGFALAILLPERRQGQVKIHENGSLLFQTALRRSLYLTEKWWNPVYLARELKYFLKRLLLTNRAL